MTSTSACSSTCCFTVVNSPSTSSSSSSLPIDDSQTKNLEARLTATHLSGGAVRLSRGKSGGKKGHSGHHIAKTIRDGRIVSKAYYPEGPRPQPVLSSLNRQISVTLQDQTAITVSTSLTVPVFLGSYFSLSSFTGYTGYTNLFDQYRIDEIEVWFESANQNNTIATCQMATCVDLDDATTPGSFGDVAMRQGALITNCMAGHYHRFVPHVAIAEYSGAFTSYGNSPPTWIDVVSPNVQHYGVKLATASADGVVRNIAVNYRAKVSFRGSAI